MPSLQSVRQAKHNSRIRSSVTLTHASRRVSPYSLKPSTYRSFFNMSSTPLLSGSNLPAPIIMQDHPVFLRASHSAWRWIDQKALVILRGAVLAYLAAAVSMTGHYKMTEETGKSGLSNLFDFSMISSAMVFVYHLITFSWTYTHLYHPEPAEVEGRVERFIVKAMSLPQNMGSQRKQFYFNLFYSATTVFSFMNSTIYWFITRQHDAGAAANFVDSAVNITSMASAMNMPDAPFSDLLGEGWFKAFIMIHLHAANSLLMSVEMLCFNSIKRPLSVGSHMLGLMALSGLYLAWAAIGKSVTGEAPFFWMDEAQVGSKEAVSLYSIGFVLLAPMMYTLMQGFIGIRESLVRPRHSSSS
ncbi:hypothetical protein E4U43_004469 [Claviceps pusilla]|uniref:Uncharacterized protein n=1 Tax=Claviceps pusilla TaxID=123648 RepID=A0A9P7N640_9HYPO|nr:hypothetical protein E4U43_004469 [Claviceps pusilla]